VKRLSFALIFVVASSLLLGQPAGALGLKVAPLEYRETLAKNEKKQGFIDVSNPTGEVLTITTSVRAFKQTDNNGGLEFYKDEFLSKGVKLELDSFELKSREALRMFFTVDGSKLPSGDVYGAIFFKTSLKTPKNGVGQQIQVGTLLSLINGTPGARNARIVGAYTSPVQVGSTIEGEYTITNESKAGSGTGFYPTVSVRVWPGETKQQQGRLLFAERTRTNPFVYEGASPGFHTVSIGYGESKVTRWVLIAPGWVYAVASILLILGLVELVLWRRRKRKKLKRSKQPKEPISE